MTFLLRRRRTPPAWRQPMPPVTWHGVACVCDTCQAKPQTLATRPPAVLPPDGRCCGRDWRVFGHGDCRFGYTETDGQRRQVRYCGTCVCSACGCGCHRGGPLSG